MAERSLPVRPDLDQYKKQAKELLKGARAGDADARRRFIVHHPRFANTSPDSLSDALALADAQLVIAREHGIESWPRFVRDVEARLGDEAPRVIWRAAERALESGDAETLERLLREHEATLRKGPALTSWLGGLQPDFSASDVKSIIASNHEFDSWDQFAAFAREWKRAGSPVAQFEAAVDAIVTGDIATLSQRLRERPELIRMRSMRKHHSTLLHYVGANGVEGFRQRTPKNAVAICQLLLDAGAEVDAPADMYGGGSTTVGLVATSCHPRDTGVQQPLIDLLIGRGASIGRPGAGGGTTYPLINSCLANGRPEAAEHLSQRGAPIDLEAAAGLGRLDLVRAFFSDDGTLTNGATTAQMHDGFSWACEYGRTEVVRFLIDRGMDVTARLRPHRQTGLHWAAHGGHVDTVKVLLAHRAPLDVRDESFEGIPLEWAMHGWSEERERGRGEPYYEVVALLVAAGTFIDPKWVATDEHGRPTAFWLVGDARMLAVLVGR